MSVSHLVDLIVRSETVGLDEDETIELAALLAVTGLVNTTGSNQRFVANVAYMWPVEYTDAVALLRQEGQ